jgi:hypothetical protein
MKFYFPHISYPLTEHILGQLLSLQGQHNDNFLARSASKLRLHSSITNYLLSSTYNIAYSIRHNLGVNIDHE